MAGSEVSMTQLIDRGSNTQVSITQQRVEDKRLLAAFGGNRRGVRSIGRIEQARFGRGLRLGVGRRSRSGRRIGGRRQVQGTFASTTGERQHGHSQDDNSPSRRFRSQITIHDGVPNAGRTLQRLPWSGECRKTTQLQRNSNHQPNFCCFSSRLTQAFACAATFFGAVPPKLVRLLTEASTESARNASTVILGSTSCIAASGNSCSATPALAAMATIRPVTWWASRNGIFSVRTSQSARSVAVA